VADGAVGVGQSIRMKVRLLERGAEEEKDGAQDNKYKACARLRCRMLTHSSHDYRYYTSIRFQASIRGLASSASYSQKKMKASGKPLEMLPSGGLAWTWLILRRLSGLGFIVKRADRNVATRTCVIAWRLYAILTCLNVHSPHCDFCDGPSVVRDSSHRSSRSLTGCRNARFRGRVG
jgi:hypothetical protein